MCGITTSALLPSRATSAGRQKSGAPAEGIAGCAPELRNLTRTRKQLVREIAQHTLRIQKTLEDANLKLSSVLSNVIGASGRAILSALIAGETDPERLADLAQGTARHKRTALIAALHGR